MYVLMLVVTNLHTSKFGEHIIGVRVNYENGRMDTAGIKSCDGSC